MKNQQRIFSKSKLLALRQCPKRLWLEIHSPDLREDSDATEASYQVGYEVGDIARRIYDPKALGALIDPQVEGFAQAFARSTDLLKAKNPIFEAGFSANGAMAFADVLLPSTVGKDGWRMVEVKSSTSVKDYHRDDIAVQAFVARSAGVDLQSIALAHIDSSWTYPGDSDYRGLLVEEDLTAEAFARGDEVLGWIGQAQAIVANPSEPPVKTGAHCDTPYSCGFHTYCSKDEPKAEYPVEWLPRISSKKLLELADQGIHDLRNVDDNLLNAKQRLVKTHTLANEVFFDATGAAADLAHHGFPSYFLDFETIQFAVPIWKGTRPYQQIPFQFSLHTLTADGKCTPSAFLELYGNDPSEPFAKALLAACGDHGPVYVYNAGFETARIKELADRFPDLSASLLAINLRVVDLLPVARERYYHPSQQGSWSIKKVLPAVVPELRYDALEGVQDGGMAMNAFKEAIHPATTAERKSQIEQQLLAYCQLDTYAMVRLWQVFSGNTNFQL